MPDKRLPKGAAVHVDAHASVARNVADIALENHPDMRQNSASSKMYVWLTFIAGTFLICIGCARTAIVCWFLSAIVELVFLGRRGGR
jgi:hypothetical protein